MILVIEIALIVVGLIALFGGKLTLSKTKVVQGAPARLLGLLALTPLPIAFVVIFVYTAANNPANPEQFLEDKKLTITLIEAGVVLGIAAMVFGIGAMIAKDPTARRRRDEYDDRDEYDNRDDGLDDRQRRTKNPWE